jgi:hypothetical protein
MSVKPPFDLNRVSVFVRSDGLRAKTARLFPIVVVLRMSLANDSPPIYMHVVLTNPHLPLKPVPRRSP